MIELINKNRLEKFIENSSKKLNKVNRKINGRWVVGTYIPTMSTFKELDTGNYYIFNANGGDTYVYKDIYSKTEKTYYLGEWIEVDSVPENIQYTCLSTELTKFNNNKANRIKNKTKYISKGERCFTLDTKTIYVFDELNNKWVENKFKENIGGGTGSSIDSKELNKAVENYISTNKIGADNIKMSNDTTVEDTVNLLKESLVISTATEEEINTLIDNLYEGSDE